MSPEREIRAKELLQDVRDGMTPSQLMAKYKLSYNGLRDVVRQLTEARVIGSRDSEDKASSSALFDDVELSRVRKFPRYQPTRSEIRVAAAEYPGMQYPVFNVSEDGIGVTSLQVKIGDTLSFTMMKNEVYPVDGIGFDAECRWISLRKLGALWEAGFEITLIEDDDYERLLSVIGTIKNESRPESREGHSTQDPKV
jgi:hypothetical protein